MKYIRLIKCKNCGNQYPSNEVCNHCKHLATESDGLKSKNSKKKAEEQKPQQSHDNLKNLAWKRFLARSIDGFVGALFIVIVLTIGTPHFLLRTPDVILTMINLACWVLIESILLTTWGTTPGKWLLRITVRSKEGQKLTFSEAFNRSATVWWKGMGTGFFLISFFTLAYAYSKFIKKGTTSWDRKGEFTVLSEKVSLLRKLTMALIIVASTLAQGLT